MGSADCSSMASISSATATTAAVICRLHRRGGWRRADEQRRRLRERRGSGLFFSAAEWRGQRGALEHECPGASARKPWHGSRRGRRGEWRRPRTRRSHRGPERLRPQRRASGADRCGDWTHRWPRLPLCCAVSLLSHRAVSELGEPLPWSRGARAPSAGRDDPKPPTRRQLRSPSTSCLANG